MRLLFLSLLILLFGIESFAQELNCRISLNRQQIQGTNEELYRSMQQDLYEFMNNRKWTKNVFANNERIECQININLSKYNGIDKFKGKITVQSSRPIYGTNYKSTIFNYAESTEFEFYYTEGAPLEFNENTHLSNLTSVLAFYAYIIIGLDYDSFGMMAGTEYLNKAKQILNNAQSEPLDQNWQAFGTNNQNNRYYLIEHMTDSDNASLRRFNYTYHRLGLDAMSEKPEAGRQKIQNAMQYLKAAYNRNADSNFLNVLLSTKDKEIVNIFSEAPQQQKSQVYNILKDIDPTNNEFEKIMKNN